MTEDRCDSNVQDLLKTIALIAMIVDHLGMYIFIDLLEFRAIGRFAFPVFTFFAGYNFYGKMRHIIWIFGLFLIISSIYIYGLFQNNILISIALGQLYLSYFGLAILKNEWMFFRHFCAMLIFTFFTYLLTDYGTLTIVFMMAGLYAAHKSQDLGYFVLAILSFILFEQYNHPWLFNKFSLAVTTTVVIINAGLCISLTSYRDRIFFPLRFISRNSLYIYAISTVWIWMMV